MSNSLPLKIRQTAGQPASVELAGVELAHHLTPTGVSVEYVDGCGGLPMPVVTLTFGAGRLDLDFDVELLERLLADARARV